MCPKPNFPSSEELQLLRSKIAAVAARLIAQDGADYTSAKLKASMQVLGATPPAPNLLPDNLEVEHEVRQYQALFQAHTQPPRLKALRAAALQVMEALAEFSPYLTGPVLHGTAGKHDFIHLQLFADSAKEVEIFLLNRNVDLDIGEAPHFKGGRHDPVETVSFPWHGEQVVAELYEKQDLRGALKARPDGSAQRADIKAVRELLASPGEHSPINTLE